MDVTLGPWTAAHVENKPLAVVMGEKAWKTVEKAAGFTPKEASKGKSKGYGISGRVNSVVKHGNSVQVLSTFTIWVDGTLSNVAPIQGAGSAEGSSTAEDAMRGITENRITKNQCLQMSPCRRSHCTCRLSADRVALQYNLIVPTCGPRRHRRTSPGQPLPDQ